MCASWELLRINDLLFDNPGQQSVDHLNIYSQSNGVNAWPTLGSQTCIAPFMLWEDTSALLAKCFLSPWDSLTQFSETEGMLSHRISPHQVSSSVLLSQLVS